MATATNAANGGVAVITRIGAPQKELQVMPKQPSLETKAGGKRCCTLWARAIKHLKVASLYGYGGAATDGVRFRLNEDLISRALVWLLEAGDTP